MALGYDGSIRIDTKINSREFKTGVDSMTTHFTSGMNKMMASLGKLAAAVGIAFGVAAVVNFGKEAVKAASDLSGALTGLQSIMDGQGRSFKQAQAFIQDYIKDGLIPMENAVTAYKNLAMRGYSTEQIEQTLVALKDASAFGRQASLSMGEAVSTATEGLRNENSILVDNAGVTKNVAKMWEDYAKTIGTSAQKLTQQQKIQAEVNGIMEESKYQVGDAAKVSQTYAGQVSMLSFQFQQLKVALGEAIIPVAKAIIPGIQSIIEALTQLANVFAQVTTLMFGKEIKNPAKNELENQKELENGLTEAGKDAANATDGLTDATEGMGDASKETAKKMQGVLSDFDVLKKLAGDTSKSIEGTTDGLDDLNIGDVATDGELFGNVTINPEVEKFVQALKRQLQELADILSRIWAVFKDAWEKYGAGVMDAAKAALNSIWELIKAIAKTFADVFSSGAGERFLENVMTIIAGILNFISTLADQFKDVWDRMGEDLVEAFFYALNSVLELVISIGSAFAEAWNSGVGVEILETIMSILTHIFELIGTIANKLQEAWEANGNGVAIWTSILNIISDVLKFIDRVVEATVNWAKGLDLEPVMSTFRRLLEAVEPLVAVILDGLAWAYENVLLPLAGWIIEDAAPAGIDLLSAAIDALTAIIEALQPLAMWLWENFLEPLTQWAGDVIVSSLKSLTDVLKRFGEWVSENKEAVETFVIIIGSFLTAWGAATAVAGIISAISGALTALAAAGGLAGIALTALGSAIAFLTSPIGIIVIAVGALIAIIVLLAKNWDKVTEAAGAAWDFIVEKWNAAGEWFSSNVINPIINGFEKLFSKIKSIVSNIVDLGKSIVENIVETIKSFIGSITDFITNAVKTAVDAIKSLFQTADSGNVTVNTNTTASNSIIQGIPAGFNGFTMPVIPTAAVYTMPKLANGAVIPPNQQFAAILGDQRSGTNIEAPLSTIEQAVANALAKNGSSGSQEIVIQNHVNLDGREVFQNQKKIGRLMGKSLVKAGG